MGKFLGFITLISLLFVLHATTIFAAESDAIIETNNVSKGIVTVQYLIPIEKKIKLQVALGKSVYNYDIVNNEKANFPLQMGAGNYKITVFENTTGTKYRAVVSKEITVGEIADKVLYTNSIQNVNFNGKMNAIIEMKKLIANCTTDKERINIIYNYMIDNIVYDYDKAKKITSTNEVYLPSIDATYKDRKGICYDYSSLFASILRELGIPAKLQFGNFTEVKSFHAWNQILMDGKWVTIDTTYDAQAKSYKMEFSQVKDASLFSVTKQF